MTRNTILLTAAMVGAGAFAAAAQTGSGSGGAATDASRVSPATHCIDRATNQARPRTGQTGTTATASGAGGPTTTGNPMDGASGMGGTPAGQAGSGMGGSAAGVSGADLERC